MRSSIMLAMLAGAALHWAVPDPAAASCAAVAHADEDLRALNGFWKKTVRLCRLPRGTYNAFADLDEGVVYADEDWLDLVARRFGNWAATGILAHEWGHFVQRGGNGIAAELQADCLAGVFMRGSGLGKRAIEEFAAVNRFAAAAPARAAGHGSPAQRVKAALRGYEGFRGDIRPATLAVICPLSAR